MSKYQNSRKDGGAYEQFQTNPNFPVTYHFAEDLKHNITPAHWHEHIELLCVIRGELRIYVKGNVIEAAPGGDAVIMVWGAEKENFYKTMHSFQHD